MESRDGSEAASGTCHSKTIDDKEALRHIHEAEADCVEAKSDEKAMNAMVDIIRVFGRRLIAQSCQDERWNCTPTFRLLTTPNLPWCSASSEAEYEDWEFRPGLRA